MAEGFKLALDVPSGICSDTGGCLVVLSWQMQQLLLVSAREAFVMYPGTDYAGQVHIANVGIRTGELSGQSPEMYTYDSCEQHLPDRTSSGNKGNLRQSFAGGREQRHGRKAAILAARAAYRTGAGMVKVITAEENRQILQQGIPEALYGSCRQLSESMEWADVIAIGPGIGREEQARECLKK